MTVPAEAAAWLAKADHDVLNIENNLASALVPWDTVCFHAQQAVEETLKAYLILQAQVPPRTHDLGALLDQCAAFDPALTDLRADCDALAGAAVLVRYPDDLLEPDEAATQPLLASMRRVLDAIAVRLGAL